MWERQIRTGTGILEGLLKTHGQSLNDEALRTLMAELESITNCRLLTVKTLGDIVIPIVSFHFLLETC